MTEEQGGGSLEAAGEEASKDANVTIDEPTAPALDINPDPSTEWEKAGAEAVSQDEESDEEGSEEDDADGSDDTDGSEDSDDDSGQS